MEDEREAPAAGEEAPDAHARSAATELRDENDASAPKVEAQDVRLALPADERMDHEATDDVLRTFTTLMFVAAIICAIPRQIWSVVILVVLGTIGAALVRMRSRRLKAAAAAPATRA